MADKIVYSSKVNAITIDGNDIKVKGITPPMQRKWQHEDDMQGGGVVEVASYERTLRFTIGMRADGTGGYDWPSIEDSEIIIYYQSGKKVMYRNCYFAESTPGEYAGQGAATEDISIIVGDEKEL